MSERPVGAEAEARHPGPRATGRAAAEGPEQGRLARACQHDGGGRAGRDSRVFPGSGPGCRDEHGHGCHSDHRRRLAQDGSHQFVVVRLPEELRLDAAGFEALWDLHADLDPTTTTSSRGADGSRPGAMDCGPAQ